MFSQKLLASPGSVLRRKGREKAPYSVSAYSERLGFGLALPSPRYPNAGAPRCEDD